ncbi:MAG: hypothetical protein PF693_12270 [Spirochaetia bacterium]|jgi:DNA-binding response OmpR family regulator|nr:hypothetical protein [Spirochaetia bacterium]
MDEESSIIKYKELSLDSGQREAFYKDVKIEITALQFSLLSIFIKSPGQVFTRAVKEVS